MGFSGVPKSKTQVDMVDDKISRLVRESTHLPLGRVGSVRRVIAHQVPA